MVEGLREFLVAASRGGGRNFRGVGRWRTLDGRRVAEGRVFRSGHLGEVGPEVREGLSRLELRTVVSFQTRPEIEILGDPVAELLPAVGREHIPIGDRWFQEDSAILDELESQGEFYVRMVRDHPELWARFFRLFTRPERFAVLYHCTAGRDRTGVATVLLLETLGVPRPAIVEDYLRSNEVFAENLQEAEVLEPMFRMIDGKGGIDGLLGDLGLDRAEVDAIRGHLLVD